MENYIIPKVLIINGEPFNTFTATGITMSNLFNGWPEDKIFQIYSAKIQPNIILCKNNIKLSNTNLRPFIYFIRKSKKISSTIDNSHFFSDESIVPPNNKVFRKKIIEKSKKIISPMLELLSYKLHEEDLKKIQEFEPDVIYTMLGNARITRLVQTLSDKLNIPVVPHFMDDWISTYSVPGSSIGTPIHIWMLDKIVKKLFESVPLAMSIGELMSKEYESIYKRQFYDFMNPVVVDNYFPQLNKQREDETVRFVYVGGLHLGRAECLGHIAAILNKKKIEGKHVELHIYVPVKDVVIAKQIESSYDCVIYKGSISPEQIHEILIGCDVGIHVESFTYNCAKYTRLSVSTKIPQYFAAGVPILAYGPSSLASCNYVISKSAGILVSQQNNDDLTIAINTLINEKNFRLNMGLNGWKHACKCHEITAVKKRFLDLLQLASKTDIKKLRV